MNKMITYGFSWNSPKFQQFVLNMNNNHDVIRYPDLQIAQLQICLGQTRNTFLFILWTVLLYRDQPEMM